MEKHIKNIKPRVSIGLPVYNGDKYIEEAIKSILAQTYADFELIISDNNSTDRTCEICQEYSAKDPRIHYHKNEQNIGAAPNFNRVFEMSVGEYFKWAAHDDILSSDFLMRCVEVLDRNPSSVLCYSKVRIIDEYGKSIEDHDPHLNIESPKPHERFRNLLRGHRCFQIFGLIRTDILRKTPLMGNYARGDGVLLARLGLFGQMLEIQEYLFFPRKHPEQSMNLFGCYQNGMPDYHSYSIWFDPKKKGKIIFPYWKLLHEYFSAVLYAPLTLHEQLKCYLIVIYWIRRWRWYLAKDILIGIKQLIQPNTYIVTKDKNKIKKKE